MRFIREKLHSGLWMHSRGTWFLSRGIRFALNKWEQRVCTKVQQPFKPVWGNHDGMFIGPNVPSTGPAAVLFNRARALMLKSGIPRVDDKQQWYIGEALQNGSVLTPIESYETSVTKGDEDVRVFEIMPRSPTENVYETMWHAAINWTLDVEGHPYNYWAYPGLILDALFGWDVDTGKKFDFYCTQGIAKAFKVTSLDAIKSLYKDVGKYTPAQAVAEGYHNIGYDVLQDDCPTPMHVEQVSDLIPRPTGRIITLREVTDDVIEK